MSPQTRSKIWIATADGRVCGVAYFGRQLALACEPEALDIFAEYAARHRGERMLIGERETVREFWNRVRRWHQRARVVRDRQLVMMLDRERLKPYEATISARHARADEWPLVAESSALLIEQELEYDPRRSSPDFNNNVRQMIERDLWWVGESGGRACFFCNIGPWCRKTAQLQGIWTPPELRGRGIATAALSAICDKLLDLSPTLSLYVNDFNATAIALYKRIGFQHVADYQTLLF